MGVGDRVATARNPVAVVADDTPPAGEAGGPRQGSVTTPDYALRIRSVCWPPPPHWTRRHGTVEREGQSSVATRIPPLDNG
jgi:hypothetical protein